jgi:hypothetical protein
MNRADHAPPPASEGVFYVATGQEQFIVEACRSATSLKACGPGIHVTLFTDLTDLARRHGVFDAIEPLPAADVFASATNGGACNGRTAMHGDAADSELHQLVVGTGWGSGLLGKVRAFVRAPYEKSLYLDTDTRILHTRIRDLFALLDRYELAIAPCRAGESRGQELYGRPMFNSGVIAFRAAPAVRQLMDAWLALQEAHAKAIQEGEPDRFPYVRHIDGQVSKLYQLVADQTSLARYLSPEVNRFGVRYFTLPKIWNWRDNDIDEANRPLVVIHHANRYKVDRA